MTGPEAILRLLKNGRCAVWFCVRAAQDGSDLCVQHEAEIREAGKVAAYQAEQSLSEE